LCARFSVSRITLREAVRGADIAVDQDRTARTLRLVDALLR